MKRTDPSRVRPKPVVGFALQAIVLTFLLGNWSTPRELYVPLFHAHANWAFATLSSVPVELRPPSPGAKLGTDTIMYARPEPGKAPVWSSWFSAQRIGYWPIAALVAMLLATPLTPGRRALAALMGIGLLDALTLGRIGVEIAYANYEWSHGPGEAARGPLHLLLRTGSESLTATIPTVACIFGVWVAVASPWRTIDLAAARKLTGMPPPPTPEPDADSSSPQGGAS